VRKYLKINELRFCVAQKSAQGFEKKGDRSKHVGTFEGLKVGTLIKMKLAIQIQKLKTKKRRGEGG
jgi:hypothetical protein